MRAGLLRHAVTIERPTDTEDGQGGFTRVWQTALATWAKIEPFGEKDQVLYQQLYPRASHNVVIRHTAQLKRGDRLIFGERVLEVEGIRNVDERGEELRLVCSERQE